ncbi:phosphate/phosphite/phosphonate ABC transporter substrate-binding protein [Piscinibacter sp. HJYY11]|uniref:phosphate/phosphite/phosphonate ABC transporter substrate-binding protein n=1 Tax=Piscinibacter sp. HJYY11 TaxID=2801333 RepID=UPI00191D39D4|nr:phosphate/phosphite/phosphonate ABC transporter substrate-binding protein [Piscinibacter sp. HJYY11]MBL0726112.1 PhnD/SsuA/transferrin family substrate-binding protein [Piscinibacter sp. HJYY11]
MSYYPWITQHRSAAEVHRNVEVFASVVAKEMGSNTTIKVLPGVEVNKQIDQLLAGDSELALMNPLGYVFARRRPNGSDIASIAIALRTIDGVVGDNYFAQIYTRADTALRKDAPQLPDKLKGRSIGYGVPYSTSNFLVNAFSLKQKLGVHPFTHFARVEFLGGHDLVAKAVYEGQVDIGAGHDGVIIDLANQDGYRDANQKLVQLVRSDPIPSDPVVARVADHGERAALQDALVAAGKSAEGKAALEIFWGMVQGLKAIEANTYDLLNDTMTALGLEERDLLRPL